MAPADILAVVENQFAEVRNRLDEQLIRTVGLQDQLDADRREIEKLRRTVDTAHQLLKQLVARDA